jgi:hypothetical protein
MSTAICIVDTETDGLHAGRQAWEVAMLRRTERGEKRLTLFVSVNLATADPYALSIGGFYDRHPDGMALTGTSRPRPVPGDVNAPVVTPYHAAVAVAQWTHGTVIVGSNPSFDTITLDALLRAHSLVPGWHYRPIDVVDRAVGWLAARGIVMPPDVRTDDVYKALGLPERDATLRHTAMGDVDMAAAILDAVAA